MVRRLIDGRKGSEPVVPSKRGESPGSCWSPGSATYATFNRTAWCWAAVLWVLVAVTGLSGCANNALVLKGQLERQQQEQLALSNQYKQLQERAAALDQDNQQLQSLLAQSRQESRLLEDQLAAVREQLRSTAAQLAQLQSTKEQQEQRVEALTASMRRQGTVTIRPNNSLLQTLPQLDLPPGHVRRDGEVIRIALPADRLFAPGTAQLQPGAANFIADAAAELYRLYPQQIIGIEGYTDSAAPSSSFFHSQHELSAAQAMAVYDVVATRSSFRPEQLFVAGHGANHPLVSNATPQGRQTNRRVELVVYPEQLGR